MNPLEEYYKEKVINKYIIPEICVDSNYLRFEVVNNDKGKRGVFIRLKTKFEGGEENIPEELEEMIYNKICHCMWDGKCNIMINIKKNVEESMKKYVGEIKKDFGVEKLMNLKEKTI